MQFKVLLFAILFLCALSFGQSKMIRPRRQLIAPAIGLANTNANFARAQTNMALVQAQNQANMARINAQNQANLLRGQAQANMLRGQAQANLLRGQAQANLLRGQAQTNLLYGQAHANLAGFPTIGK